MKKILSILGTIGLTATSTTTLISCEKPNNNENGGNKPDKPWIPQQPPENSSWKLIDASLNNIQKEFEKHNDKWYFIIWKRENSSNWIWQSMFFKYDESAPRMTGAWLSSIKSIYRWDNTNKTKKLEFNESTGDVIFWTDNEYQNTRSFLLKYLNLIVQENIRVQQGGNPDYDDPNLGSQRIIFDFEIINNLDKASTV